MSVLQEQLEELHALPFPPVIPPAESPACIEISGRGMAVRALGNLLLMLPAEITERCITRQKRGWFRQPLMTIFLTRTAARAVLHMIETHRAVITRAAMAAKPGNYGVSMRDAHTFILLTAVRSLFPTNGILPEPIEIS